MALLISASQRWVSKNYSWVFIFIFRSLFFEKCLIHIFSPAIKIYTIKFHNFTRVSTNYSLFSIYIWLSVIFYWNMFDLFDIYFFHLLLKSIQPNFIIPIYTCFYSSFNAFWAKLFTDFRPCAVWLDKMW